MRLQPNNPSFLLSQGKDNHQTPENKGQGRMGQGFSAYAQEER